MYASTSGPISVQHVPHPVCPPGGAVLAVRATGICRPDWHAWHGREDVALPHIGGHEYAGAIASVRSLRRRGRHVQVGLLHGADATPPLSMDRVIGWELELLGSHGMSARDYPAMLDMVISGRLRPDELITRKIGLDGIGDALSAMDAAGSDGITVAIP